MTLADGRPITLGLENAKVLVTGGGTGIGRATARDVARAGNQTPCIIATPGATPQGVSQFTRPSPKIGQQAWG